MTEKRDKEPTPEEIRRTMVRHGRTLRSSSIELRRVPEPVQLLQLRFA